MAVSEYRKKGDVIAWHFTDGCDYAADLEKLGVKYYNISLCNNNGVERVTIAIMDENKRCLATGILGDYIIRECNYGKLSFKILSKERFEYEHEFVQDIDTIDDECSHTSMKDMFVRK